MNNSNVMLKEAQELIPAVVALLHEHETATMIVRGRSMRPFVEGERDLAVLSLPGEIRVGDAVLARVNMGCGYVLHRVVARRGDQLTLQGDGNPYAQEHCAVSDVVAMVVGFLRKGRKQPDMVTGLKWRMYSWIWMTLRPVRRYLLAIHRRLFR